MTTRIVGWIIKCVALAIAAAGAFVYWQKRDDGRYVYQHQPAAAETSYTSDTVIDTRTGTVYLWGTADLAGSQETVFLEVHPQTRTMIGGKANVVVKGLGSSK